jgi:hypothetical protein
LDRYIYICHPTAAKTWCTIPRVTRATITLFVMAFSVQLSRFFDSKYEAIQFTWNGSQHWGCRRIIAYWVENIIKTNIYYPLYYGFRIIFVNIGPCAALVVLNFLLFRALRVSKLIIHLNCSSSDMLCPLILMTILWTLKPNIVWLSSEFSFLVFLS